MESIRPVILAGGGGERLWPLSRPDFPKQFVVQDPSGQSLFQATVRRVADRNRYLAPLILCAAAHERVVEEQLAVIGVADATLILEPAPRNTAAAIALAAQHCANSPALMLVLPSDHYISAPEKFAAAVHTASAAARAGKIVTFGITPSGPETGFGYIECGDELAAFSGVRQLRRFVEKPDVALATQLLSQGNYGWNSGMFMMDAATVIAEMRTHAPAIADACKKAYAERATDGHTIVPDEKSWSASPAIAFDYAVMERTSNAAVLPVEFGWHDLGGWATLAAVMPMDDAGNSITGEANLVDSRGSIVHASTLNVVAIGLTDMVIVEHAGQVLVAPKARAAEVRGISHKVQNVTQRPWGHFTRIDSGAEYQVKKLTIKPGHKISLQAHRSRSEHWVVVKGEATVTRGDEIFMLWANQSTYIAAGQQHRLENRGAENLVIIEVQTGNYLGEDDIERFEDVYARPTQPA